MNRATAGRGETKSGAKTTPITDRRRLFTPVVVLVVSVLAIGPGCRSGWGTATEDGSSEAIGC
jgi:hypothetical protein